MLLIIGIHCKQAMPKKKTLAIFVLYDDGNENDIDENDNDDDFTLD